MAGFLYYLAAESRVPSPETLRAWRLDYAFTAPPERCEVNKGPGDNGPGVVIGDSSRHVGKRVGFYPDQQTWRKMPKLDGRPEVWVGYWNDAKPGPEDLRREKMLRGKPMVLADGNEWQIPIVRSFDDDTKQWISQLPCYLDCDDDGTPKRGRTMEAYAYLWNVTAPIAFDAFAISAGEDVPSPSEKDIVDAAVALLQANYRVGLGELALLECLTDDEMLATLVLISCRYDTLMAWISQKKTRFQLTENGAISCAGEAA